MRDNDTLTITIHYSCAMTIKSVSHLFLMLGAVIALPLMLAACEDMGDGSDMQSQQPQAFAELPAAPEAPIETIPMLPDPQSEIWRPGYWRLSAGQFVWVPGKVIQRPSPTAVWASAVWVHHNYGWSFQEGHWE
jgi:hypothetical protein